MFVLVRHKLLNEYKVVYRKDIQQFLNLKNFFTTDFKFEIIDEVDKIREVLEEHFTSKGRSSEYNENLPSATKIVHLYPIDINSDKFLLRWQNDTDVTVQRGDTQDILNRGSLVHSILEYFVLNQESRKQDKIIQEKINILKKAKKPYKNIQKKIDEKLTNELYGCLEKSCKDDEIKRKIQNLGEIKAEISQLIEPCLLPLVKELLIYTDLKYSEIFLQNNSLQGSVDYTCFKDGNLTICDYKTTSSLDKKTGKPKFKSTSQLLPYAVQLYIYFNLLKDNNMVNVNGINDINFNIIQIHLKGNKYKIFNIEHKLIKNAGKTVDKLLQWYKDVRFNKDYQPLVCEENDDEISEFISL